MLLIYSGRPDLLPDLLGQIYSGWAKITANVLKMANCGFKGNKRLDCGND